MCKQAKRWSGEDRMKIYKTFCELIPKFILWSKKSRPSSLLLLFRVRLCIMVLILLVLIATLLCQYGLITNLKCPTSRGESKELLEDLETHNIYIIDVE